MADKIYGWQDYYDYNPNFFVILRPTPVSNNIPLPSDMKDIVIIAKIDSDDESISANWESPLEGQNPESGFSVTATLAQQGVFNDLFKTDYGVGQTLVTSLETLQRFNGIEPQTLNLSLDFVAIKDAYKEVEAPFLFLKKMLSPQLTKGIIYENIKSLIDSKDIKGLTDALGSTPFDVSVTFGNNKYMGTRFIIENVTSSRDSIQLDSTGNPINRKVSITLKSKKAIMRNEIIIK